MENASNKPIFGLTVSEFKAMVEADIELIKTALMDHKVRNWYKALEYKKKLQDFLTLDYFKGGYRNVRDILENLKFFYQDSYRQIIANKGKIDEIRKIKRLKGQLSFFDSYSLTEEEQKRASTNPQEFIDELKEANKKLEKDYKLARFMIAYIMNFNNFLSSIGIRR